MTALAIGSSTGGPNALSAVFASFPRSLGVPVFLTQHMPPVFTRMLAEQLRASGYDVVEATDRQIVESSKAYVAPGNFHMTVVRDGTQVRIVLNQDPPENSCRPAVDVMFRSLAEVYGSGLLASVLTGMGHDGARGAQDVVQAGGEVVVQDAASCVVPSMPNSVAAAVTVAGRFPIERLGTELASRISRRALPPDADQRERYVPMNASPDSFKFIAELVHRKAAIVIEAGKEYLVESRLGPIARTNGFASIDAMVDKLRTDDRGKLCADVIEAMTTNETSFFRDLHPFEALRTQVIPELIKARQTERSIKIWCAAASTGQEPYSIALTIREHFPELASWNVQIVATDINVTVLERARTGIFRQLEVNRGLPAVMLVKHFEKTGADWQIKPNIRSMITFQEANLLGRWPLFTKQDVVFMRNVLIYFDVPTKRDLLRRVRENMRDDGFLFLGGAETTMNIDNQLVSTRSSGPSTVYRQAKAVLGATG